jgi:hypothetical protein
VDLGARLFRRVADGRVLLGQPPADRRRIPLEGPAARLLRGEPPALQVAADGPDRDIQAAALGEEPLDGLPGPEGEGQAELIRAAAEDQPDDQGRFVRGQPGLGGGRPRRFAFKALAPPRWYPVTQRVTVGRATPNTWAARMSLSRFRLS